MASESNSIAFQDERRTLSETSRCVRLADSLEEKYGFSVEFLTVRMRMYFMTWTFLENQENQGMQRCSRRVSRSLDPHGRDVHGQRELRNIYGDGWDADVNRVGTYVHLIAFKCTCALCIYVH